MTIKVKNCFKKKTCDKKMYSDILTMYDILRTMAIVQVIHTKLAQKRAKFPVIFYVFCLC